jgi:glycosyltransferase involved in cell wall biosynthesis
MLVHSVYSRDPRVRRYAEYLAKLGHEIDIISLRADAVEQDPPYPSINLYPIAIKRERKGGARQAIEWFVSAFLMFLKLSYLFAKRRHDLVHVNNMPDFLVFGALAPRLLGKPVILDIHDPIPELMRSKMDLDEGHWLVMSQKFLERISVRFSSHVLTATPTFARILINRGAPRDKVTVVMNAADPVIFGPGEQISLNREDSGRFTMLYLGTVAKRYGLEIAIRALPIIRERVPHILLRIVTRMGNEGEEVDRLLNLAKELNVDDLMGIEPPVPLERVPELMKSAQVGVYPAIKDCHMDIALSLKIPEMLTVGLPVVASRLAILEELFEEGAMVYFPTGDYSAMAQKIIELHDKPEIRQELAYQGALAAEELSWDGQFKIYLNVLERLIPNGPDRLHSHGPPPKIDQSDAPEQAQG